MSVWDATTWVTVAVLGPGAVIVFLAFVRDLRRLLRDARTEDDGPM